MPDSWNLRPALVCNDTSWEPVRQLTGSNTFKCPWTFSATIYRDCIQRHGGAATMDWSGYDYSLGVSVAGPEKMFGRTVYDCNDNREPIFDFGDNAADNNILLDLRGGLSLSMWLPGTSTTARSRLDPTVGRDQEYRFRIAKEAEELLPHRQWTQVQLVQEDGGGEGQARVHAYINGVEVGSTVMPCPLTWCATSTCGTPRAPLQGMPRLGRTLPHRRRRAARTAAPRRHVRALGTRPTAARRAARAARLLGAGASGAT